MKANIIKSVKGNAAIDGAGVHLTRVLGHGTVNEYDPILMLDSFDAADSSLYTRGFPMHPHRGIETVTYLAQGKIVHRDSLGNEGEINNGDVQWMTAGSGIMHEEMPQASDRMLGLQFWLNLPQAEKMTAPKYFDIKAKDIPVVEDQNSEIRVISGDYKGTKGAQPHHIQATFMDIRIPAGTTFTLPLVEDENAFLFTLQNGIKVDGKYWEEKSALLIGEGSEIDLEATEDAHLIYVSGPKLNESIAWGGPIVMNTQEELRQASMDLRNGTFIKEEAH